MSSPDFKLYFITDQQNCPQADIVSVIQQVSQAGCTAIQIREKNLTARQLVSLAEQAKQRCSDSNTSILINDRIDVMLASRADGVHLTSQGIAPGAARALCGANKIIARSTHSIDEIKEAEKQGCDFVLFGPIFPTPSKIKYGSPQGLKKLSLAAAATTLPVFAVGGIDLQNTEQCLEHGARGVAVISAILKAPDISSRVASFLNILHR